MLAATHIRGQQPLAGDFFKGDAVVSLIEHQNSGKEKVHEGDVGTVRGPCSDAALTDKSERVLVDFGEAKGRVNMLAATHIRGQQPLAGGFFKGDAVVSLIEHHNSGKEKVHEGDVGTVR